MEQTNEATIDRSEPSQQAASSSMKENPLPPPSSSTDSISTSSAAAALDSRPSAAGDGGDLADVMKLVDTGKLNALEIEALRTLVKEYSTLKIKVERLKGLLGRSAKAQREAKVEAEQAKKQLDVALQDVKRLTSKVELLSSRKTHMDLLNDFETNFDRALLSVSQTGGQDTSPQMPSIVDTGESAVDTMLMQELEECRNRLQKLESLNSALVHRASQLEAEAREQKKAKEEAMNKLAHMDLELRMSRMEAAHAQRAVEEKAASLQEMQIEIDLVTKASVKANALAAQGKEVAKASKTDRQHVLQLEAQVQALKEWALASGEAKRLALERVSMLENKLKNQGVDMDSSFHDEVPGSVVVVFTKSGSLVIGAGDVKEVVVTPEERVKPGMRLVLIWKFDSSPSDATTHFSVRKGNNPKDANSYLIKDRAVVGGAAGELEGAFQTDNTCTLLWSNKVSWIQPRTVKFQLQVVCYKG